MTDSDGPKCECGRVVHDSDAKLLEGTVAGLRTIVERGVGAMPASPEEWRYFREFAAHVERAEGARAKLEQLQGRRGVVVTPKSLVVLPDVPAGRLAMDVLRERQG